MSKRASFDGLVGESAPAFNAGKINAEEQEQVAAMREQLGPLPAFLVEECTNDFFFLRSLRCYEHDVKAAVSAYTDMMKYREEFELKAIHDEIVAAGNPWPWEMEQFGALLEIVGPRGYHRLHTSDLAGNVLTHTLVEPTLRGMNAAVKAGLTEDYVRLFRYIDEWMLIKLHGVSVERGHLVGEHQIVDVSGIGMFSFDGTIDLLKRFGKLSVHYPERIVQIDDINNTRVCGWPCLPLTALCLPAAVEHPRAVQCTLRRAHTLAHTCDCPSPLTDSSAQVAMFIWPLIQRFVPKQTARKLRLSGKDYQPLLLSQIAASELPPSMGGMCTDLKRWSYLQDLSHLQQPTILYMQQRGVY